MVKIAHRPHQISIDVAKPNVPPIISLQIQKVELDANNKITAITGYENTLYRNAKNQLTETIAFVDPITGSKGLGKNSCRI